MDLESHPGVDFVLDVRDGLPFRGTHYVYAEHFLEHLSHDDGLAFLKACRGVLVAEGVLRISTPNLDWVWQTQYHVPGGLKDCFAINKAFHGWSHQFLYNLATLTNTLQRAGFADVRSFPYGQSDDPLLSNLERHPADPDFNGAAHVIIVEARGLAGRSSGVPDVVTDYETAVHG